MKKTNNEPEVQLMEADRIMKLDLTILDASIVNYLAQFSEEEREEKALEALRVGVIAIQSASPSLDSRVVEEKFREVESKIDGFLNGFQGDLKTKLEDYFKSGSGTVPRSLEGFLGANGTIAQTMNNYFTSDGKLQKLIQEQVGPNSHFAKSIDPNNKESVLSKLENSVQNHLQAKTSEIINQFSLDIDNSALSRLQKSLFEKVGEIQNTNAAFFGELKKALGIKEGKDAESEKGTEKGREFETELYNHVAAFASKLDDTSENVRSIIGSVPRSKVGDYVLTLGDASGSPGTRVAVEVKKEQGYKLKDAIEELKNAKENREADAGIFVFAKGYEPAEVGDFYKLGNDFYLTVDEDELNEGAGLIFFEAAYKIIRIQITGSKKIKEDKGIDKEKIKAEIASLVEMAKKLGEMKTKTSTILNNAKFIQETCDVLKGELEEGFNNIKKELE